MLTEIGLQWQDGAKLVRPRLALCTKSPLFCWFSFCLCMLRAAVANHKCLHLNLHVQDALAIDFEMAVGSIT